MQSKTSFFNSVIFKKNISRTWIVGLLYFVCLLLMMPVTFIINTANIQDDWYSQLGYTMDMRLYDFMSYNPSAYPDLILAIVVTTITFWYLFNKRDNYMMHSFPVSRKSLFFTGALSAYLVAVVPVVTTGLLMTLAAVVRGATALSCIWYWVLTQLVAVLIFEAIAVFALMISGQLVTGVIFYFIFNFLYFLMDLAVRITSSMLMFGMNDAVSNITVNPLTPVEYIDNFIKVSSTIVTDDENTKVISFAHEFIGAKYLGIYSVCAIVIFVIAFVLYKYKRLETVQDFIAVPFMKPVFSVGMSFFISMVAGAFIAGMIDAMKVLSYETNFTIAIIATLIIGIIIYFATQMLIEKTLRVFCVRKAIHCLLYSVAALCILLCFRFDAFKMEDYVPKASQVEWAGISNEYCMVFTNPQDIKEFLGLHKNFLDDKEELRNVGKTKYKDVSGTTLNIKYKLKNGKTVSRSYNVVDTKADVSPEYVAATQPILDFINTPSRIKEHIIGKNWKDYQIKDMRFSIYMYNEVRQDFDCQYNDFGYLSTNEKNVKYLNVYKAFLKDIDEGNVFVQSFADKYEDEESNKTNLYNDFSFTVLDKNETYFSDNDTYWENTYMSPVYQQDIYVILNKACENTLKALKADEFYTEDDTVITYQEYNDKMGFTDNEGELYE